jgi:flagellar biosynthetic protein FlhB
MAEEDTGQEKTEQATPKRLEKAREEGQVPRSRELNTAAILLAGTAGILLFGAAAGQSMQAIMRDSFSLSRAEIFDTSYMGLHLGAAAVESITSLTPFTLLVIVAALLSPVALGGWLMSAKALQPKLNRLSPIQGLKRMFSKKALMEMFKALAKFLVVGSIAVLILFNMQQDLLTIGNESVRPAISHSVWVIAWSALAMGASMLIIVMVDVPFQIMDHAKKLKMTVQQVKDELKDTEGKPEVKSRIRQLQRDFARSRMMGAVPDADVVITNPTHYAVALKYDVEKSAAPIVVAKGADLVAFRIREVAEANEVTVLSAPPLARSIYHTTELEQQIPAGLYVAVAQVLAYVFQLNSYRKGMAARPAPLDDLEIPEELQYRN